MAQYTGLQERIKEVIRPNGIGAITAADHQALLLEIVDTLGYDINRIGDGAVKPDGKYPELTAGFANNLVGRGEAVEATINFRPSGGKSIEDGAARVKELRGNAVVWNQLVRLNSGETVEKGITFTVDADNQSIVANGVATGGDAMYGIKFNAIKDHVYIIQGCPMGGSANTYKFDNQKGDNDFGEGCIYTEPRDSGVAYNLIRIMQGTSVSNLVFKPRIIDLTLMSGAGKVPTTIEEYKTRKPIVADEYAYNEGELLSCNAEGIKSVNDNAWDEEWEKGYLNNTNGYEQDSEYFIRSKNYNRILAGETYYLKGDNSYIVLYDENKQYLDFWGMPTEGRTIVLDSRARYFKIAFSDAYGTKYKDNVIVSLYHSGYKEGQYIPHKEFIRKFDSRRIKNEFPNGLQIGDKVYNKNGQGYIQKGTGVLSNMADLDWSYITGDGRFSAYVTGFASPASVTDKGNIACVPYATLSALDTYNGTTGISIDSGRIWLRDNSLNGSVAALKNKLQGAELYYEVAYPTILEYDEPFNLDYEVWDFGTEEMLASEPSAPIRGLIAYGFNAVDEIRELRNMITSLQAMVTNNM